MKIFMDMKLDNQKNCKKGIAITSALMVATLLAIHPVEAQGIQSFTSPTSSSTTTSSRTGSGSGTFSATGSSGTSGYTIPHSFTGTLITVGSSPLGQPRNGSSGGSGGNGGNGAFGKAMTWDQTAIEGSGFSIQDNPNPNPVTQFLTTVDGSVLDFFLAMDAWIAQFNLINTTGCPSFAYNHQVIDTPEPARNFITYQDFGLPPVVTGETIIFDTGLVAITVKDIVAETNHIYINTAKPLSTDTNPISPPGVPFNLAFYDPSVKAHEIGHVLGLNDNDLDGSVMNIGQLSIGKERYPTQNDGLAALNQFVDNPSTDCPQ